jgi:hypothetical protein
MSPRVTRTLPTVQPILLTPRGEPFDDPAWLFEPKYDGYRGLLYVTRLELPQLQTGRHLGLRQCPGSDPRCVPD